MAKNQDGSWSAEEHVLLGSTSLARMKDPWIGTTSEITVTDGFDSGFGVVAIDLSKIQTETVSYKVIGDFWANDLNLIDKIIYHRSVWQREVMVKSYIPNDAITPLYDTGKE